MNEFRYVVVSNDRGRARGGGDRAHYNIPVTLDVAFEQAHHQRAVAKAGGRGDWYRVCELVDVGHGGGTIAGDSAQAKAVIMARCGVSEQAAHGVLQRLAMDLRIDKTTAARILLAGVSAVLARSRTGEPVHGLGQVADGRHEASVSVGGGGRLPRSGLQAADPSVQLTHPRSEDLDHIKQAVNDAAQLIQAARLPALDAGPELVDSLDDLIGKLRSVAHLASMAGERTGQAVHG